MSAVTLAAAAAPRPAGPPSPPRPTTRPAAAPVPRPAATTRPATVPAAAAPTNAADAYKAALALLPQQQNHPDMNVIAPAEEEPNIDEAIMAVLRKYDPAAAHLRRGAAAPRCDWGLDRSKGPELNIPHLTPARTMSNLILARARAGLHQKQGAAAAEDAAALIAFGRHIGQEPFVICKLMEVGVVQSGVEAGAMVLMHVPPDALTRVDARLAALPKAGTPADAVKGEAASTVTWLRAQEKADPASLFQRGGKLWTMAGGERGDPGTIEALQQRWTNPQTRAADLAAIGTLSDQVAAAMAGPADQLPAALQKYQADLQAAGPLVTMFLLRDPTRLIANVNEAEARLAMLRAAVAVRLKGPDALKAVRDPFGNGPFGYKPTAAGFELTSQLQNRGGPVKLTVGPAR